MSHLFTNPLVLYVLMKVTEAMLGSVGTWLETSKRPWLSKLGHKIEAFTVDLPKLFKGEVPEEDPE